MITPLGPRSDPRPPRDSGHRSPHLFSVCLMVAALGWASGLLGPGLGTPHAAGARRERERGDVPGWVLITIMTAGLVTTIWALAGAQLAELFTQAIASVTGPGKR